MQYGEGFRLDDPDFIRPKLLMVWPLLDVARLIWGRRGNTTEEVGECYLRIAVAAVFVVVAHFRVGHGALPKQ